MPPELVEQTNATARALGDVIGLVKFANEPHYARYRDWLLTSLSPQHRALLTTYQSIANPQQR